MSDQSNVPGEQAATPFLPPQPAAPVPPPPAMPGSFTPGPVVDVQQVAPKRKRAGLWVGVAAVVALAVGGGAFALTRGGDDKETFSLSAAVSNAKATSAYEFTLTTDAGGQSIDIDGALDTKTDLMSMTFDMSKLLEGSGLGGDAGGTQMNVILDVKTAEMYMGAELFKTFIPSLDADWIHLTADELGADAGGLLPTGGLPDDPLAVTDLFDQGKVVDKGTDAIDGEEVHHYVVTVDTAKAAAADPSISKRFDDAGVDVPKTIDYDVYVTKDNQLRRLAFDLDLGGQSTSTTMTIKPAAEPVVIEIPTSGVIEAKDLGMSGD